MEFVVVAGLDLFYREFAESFRHPKLGVLSPKAVRPDELPDSILEGFRGHSLRACP